MIRPVVHLDPSAVVHNVQRLRDVVAPADVWVTVKANAYGHGLIEFSRLAREAGVTGFCTLDIPTGLKLREDGFDGDLFAWLIPTSAPLVEALRSGIQLGVHALWQLRAIADAARAVGTTAAVHLKAETGLHRGGIDPEDWDAVISEAAALEGAGLIRVEAIWTHMSETAHEFDVEAVAVCTGQSTGLRSSASRQSAFTRPHPVSHSTTPKHDSTSFASGSAHTEQRPLRRARARTSGFVLS